MEGVLRQSKMVYIISSEFGLRFIIAFSTIMEDSQIEQ